MADPLIVSAKAARRLRLLLGHGTQLPAGLQAAANAADTRPPLVGEDGSLAAVLLPEPVPLPESSSGAPWRRERDVLAEVAVTLRTLQALKLPSGALVLVSNPGRPEVVPHLARLLALPQRPQEGAAAASAAAEAAGVTAAAASMADGAAYLAPSLAFNLGLALHLWPLLLHGTSDANSVDSTSTSSSCGSDRVRIQRYSLPPPQQEQQGAWHCLAQPGSEPAVVPVAAEVHISIVRTPEPALLQQHAKQEHDGSSGGAERSPGSGGTNGSSSADGSRAAGAAPAAAADASDGTAAAGAGAGADDAVAVLQQWFLAARRVVCQGDVLAVPRLPPGSSGSGSLLPLLLPNLHRGEQAPAAAGSRASAAPPQLLYFKVAKMAVSAQQAGAVAAGEAPTSAAAVDVGSTAVKLVGSCSSGLPVGLQHYLAVGGSSSGGGGSSSSSSSSSSSALLGSHAAAPAAPHPQLLPAGPLLPAWRQLAQLLASVLHPAAAGVPLRLAVLLHGPSGSGKHTAAAAASAAVGIHLVSLSCHDVKASAGAAERHTFEGLRAAFGAAADYAPSVLLLRQLSVLGDASSHGGSASASSHSYASRLGSVLAECIHTHGSAGGSSGSGGGSGTGSNNNSGGGSSNGSRLHGLHPAPVILVACTTSADDLPAPLRRCFTHELAVEAPDQHQRQALLQGSLGGVAVGPDLAGTAATASEEGRGAGSGAAAGQGLQAGRAKLDGSCLEETARHTAGLLPRELRAVAADAAAAAALLALPPAALLGTVQGSGSDSCQQEAAPALLTHQHLAAALDGVRSRTATDVGAPKIPSVHWEDVGGLQDVKRAILDTVELPLKHPELFAGGLRRRSGVLLYGPPGTGKTLLAKAVATECAISFLSIKGPELINMYVGESERQIREVFARARRARPCIVFFDELDSLAPARGRGSDSGGVMDRVVSQLLAEIDNVQAGGGDVFVVGATNRPDLLDGALLRPGRLDKLLYVGIAADVPSRLQVLQALTRRFRLGDDVDLAAVASQCAPRFTGADLYALCADAWMTALKRAIAAQEASTQQRQTSSGGAAAALVAAAADSSGSGEAGAEGGEKEEEGEEEEVTVTQADLLQAADTVQPSLSAAEVARYERIRDEYNSQQSSRQY